MNFEERHNPTGMMSHPPIDDANFAHTTPHASVYVCDDADCQDAASEHIRKQTGHTGTYRPFPARKD